MYDSSDKKEKQRPKSSIGKSGGELSLSAKDNERSKKYLTGMDTYLPEKFDYQEQYDKEDKVKNQARKMKSIRKSSFSSDEDRPDLIGEFNLDTGWSEVGFDEKKKETVVSFKSNYQNENSRSVSEEKANVLKTDKDGKVLSNDPSFETGAVSLRTKQSEATKNIRKEWEVASQKKNHECTFDDVVPFHQAEEQKNRLEFLKNLAVNSKDERTDIQRAITGVQTYINKKNMTKLNFDYKFDMELEKFKANMKSKSQADDYILMKKKQLLIEEKKLEDELENDQIERSKEALEKIQKEDHITEQQIENISNKRDYQN